MREFKVGDVCRVRQWDDMKQEFGGDEYSINCPGWLFCDDMKGLCGKQFIIAAIQQDSSPAHNCKICIPEEKDGEFFGWRITTDMLELEEEYEYRNWYTSTYEDDDLGNFDLSELLGY